MQKSRAIADFVSVGTDPDTGTFAAALIRGWWRSEGGRLYPETQSILITADGGGSTTTAKRLTVTCRLDQRKYPIGREMGNAQMTLINLEWNKFQAESNYKIRPSTKPT